MRRVPWQLWSSFPLVPFLSLLLGPLALSGRDCDRDGVEDAAAIARGAVADCNLNGVPDPCDLVGPRFGLGSLVELEVGLSDPLRDNIDCLAAADLDADGLSDLVVSVGAELVTFRSSGGGSLVEVGRYDPGTGPLALLVIDASGDGWLDPVITRVGPERWSGILAVFPTRAGTAELGEPILTDLEAHVWDLAAGAFFRPQGPPDLAVAYSASHDYSDLAFLENRGDGSFIPHPPLGLGLDPSHSERIEDLAAGDFDGDGMDDAAVLVGWAPRPRILLFLNGGSGGFQLAATLFGFPRYSNTSPSSMGVADLDLDGDLDLAAWTPLTLFLNDGNGSFTARRVPLLHYPYYPYLGVGGQKVLADLDGDRDLDLAFFTKGNYLSHLSHLNVLSNLGDGTFDDLLRIDVPGHWSWLYRLAAGDFDGDGILDLVAAGSTRGQMSIFLNRPEARADCDQNGLLDECELAAEGDCDQNGVPDRCEIEESDDCNLNGVLDACESDCNGNGLPDECDIRQGLTSDCDGDGVPDECQVHCDLAGDYSACDAVASPSDCNHNGFPDLCDLVPQVRFTVPYNFPSPADPVTSLVADLDADGSPDLVTANRGDQAQPGNSLSIHFDPFGPPSGRASRILRVGNGPRHLDAGDLDGDGDLDLVVANGGNEVVPGKSVSVILNEGERRFAPPQNLRSGLNPLTVHLVDTTGDGSLDLLVSDEGGEDGTSLILWAGDGRGGFSPPRATPLASGESLAGSSVAGDLDGDGYADVAVVHSFFTTLLFGTAGGIFTRRADFFWWGTSSFHARDDDGDGDLDLIAISGGWRRNFYLLENRGGGVFVERPPGELQGLPEQMRGLAATTEDFDGDGGLDVAISDPVKDQYLTIYFREKDGTFPLPLATQVLVGPHPAAINAADADGDGTPDLVAPLYQDSNVIRNPISTTAVVLNAGARQFLGPQRLPGPAVQIDPRDPPQPIFADVNGDGKGDLIAVQRRYDHGVTSLWIAVFHGTERGLVLASDHLLPSGTAFPISQVDLASGDLDGDGDIDLVAQIWDTFPNGWQGRVVFFNSGGGLIGESRADELEFLSGAGFLADLDGDGRADLVRLGTGEAAGRVLVEFTGPGGIFSPPSLLAGAGPFSKIAAADLDGDGRVELVGATGSELHVVRILEDRSFAAPEIYDHQSPPEGRRRSDRLEELRLADLDGDGYPEATLLRQLYPEGDSELTAVDVWVNSGDGTFGEVRRVLSVPASFAYMALVMDIAGDGRPEVLVTYYELSGGGQRVFIGNPAGPGPATSHPFQPGFLLVGKDPPVADVDGDGRDDVVLLYPIGSEYPTSYVLYRNLTRPAAGRDLDGDGVLDDCGAARFRRGDADGDGTVSITDGIVVLSHLFRSGPAPRCGKGADADDRGDLTLTDGTIILLHLFRGWGALPAPYPGCGPDPTPDLLPCEVPPSCR